MSDRSFPSFVIIATLAGAALASCQGGGPGDGLTIEESSDGIHGTFTGEGGEVAFAAETLEPNITEVVLELDGMTVVHTIDHAAGVFLLDGFATENGEDTQMTAEDRALMAEMSDALDALGSDLERPYDVLQSSVAILEEFPGTLDLRRMVLAQKDRSYYSICGWEGYYVQATHGGWSTAGDCSWWGCEKWDDASTLDGGALISDTPEQCGGAYDGTRFWTGSAWNNCYEYDHPMDIEWAYGNCFGNCGAGCQGGGREWTLDCLDHDQCVRGGHGTADLSCDDDFAWTLDDEGFAPEC